jgi:type VI secretion system protein ImpF
MPPSKELRLRKLWLGNFLNNEFPDVAVEFDMPQHILPDFWSGLFGEHDRSADWTVESLKSVIARDLEDLLNTRRAIPDAALSGFPYAQRSILAYGLVDFSAMSIGNDMNSICAAVALAISRHEPRLTDVRARLVPESCSINRIGFVVHQILLRETPSFRAGSERSRRRSRRTHFRLMREPIPVREVGIDLGLHDLAKLSDGEPVAAPNFYRDAEPALATAQRAQETAHPGHPCRDRQPPA